MCEIPTADWPPVPLSKFCSVSSYRIPSLKTYSSDFSRNFWEFNEVWKLVINRIHGCILCNLLAKNVTKLRQIGCHFDLRWKQISTSCVTSSVSTSDWRSRAGWLTTASRWFNSSSSISPAATTSVSQTLDFFQPEVLSGFERLILCN